MGEYKGEVFNANSLSKHLEMPRTTLIDRLSFLETKGFVLRDADGLRLPSQICPDENVLRMRKIIIDAGNALSKIDIEDRRTG